MKTARMTILLTPEQKSAIRAQAASLGISTGEMVRRAVENFGRAANEPHKSESEEVLNALADELFIAAKGAREALEAAEREVQLTLAQLKEKHGRLEVQDVGV